MGRLMDDILAMVGYKPSDRVPVLNTNDKDLPPSGSDSTEDSDCASCRVVGTTVMGGMSLYTLRAVQLRYKDFQGKHRMAYLMMGISLASAFMSLAISRAFNLGPFDMEKDETLLDVLKKERKQFLALIGKPGEENCNAKD